MQWDTWNKLNVEKTVKVKMHQFKSRYGLQRTILLVNMKIMLIMAATGAVFVNPAYKDIFKEIFSICLASLVSVSQGRDLSSFHQCTLNDEIDNIP